MIRKLVLLYFIMCIGAFSSYGQSLDSLLQMVVENSPELKALQTEYDAELMKVNQVRALPNMQFGVGIPVLPPETRLGPQIMMVSASQMFPWFGTRKSKGDVIIAMSKAKYERISAKRLVLFNKIELAYYALIELKEREGIISSMLDQFKAIEQSALAKQESGNGSMINVLRVRLSQDELQQQLAEIVPLREKQFAVINALTLAPWNTPIEVQDLNVEVLEIDLEEQHKKLKEHYPLLRLIDAEISASKTRQLANKKMGAPMIGAGLDYAIVGERTDMDPQFNGRDIFIPKLMLSIPLYRKPIRAIHEEERLKQSALAFDRESLEQRVMGQLAGYLSNYHVEQVNREHFTEQIKTTEQILELLYTEYSTQGRKFDELLQVQNQLLMYKLKLSKTRKKEYIAISNMKKLINY
ncbi:MAG: TolC family protein [Crocinitomicaceae bacterium]|nr:TolC family protein [Crocinitomicaceae bacterium]